MPEIVGAMVRMLLATTSTGGPRPAAAVGSDSDPTTARRLPRLQSMRTPERSGAAGRAQSATLRKGV